MLEEFLGIQGEGGEGGEGAEEAGNGQWVEPRGVVTVSGCDPAEEESDQKTS